MMTRLVRQERIIDTLQNFLKARITVFSLTIVVAFVGVWRARRAPHATRVWFTEIILANKIFALDIAKSRFVYIFSRSDRRPHQYRQDRRLPRWNWTRRFKRSRSPLPLRIARSFK